MYKISILDDHPMVIEGLSDIIEAQSNYRLIGCYSNIKELNLALKYDIPDILLLDLQLPDGKGIYLADELIRKYSQLKIIVITSMDNLYIVKEMLSKGCRGYLVKSECSTDDVLIALEKVVQGGIYLPHNLHQELMKDITQREKKSNQSTFLSMREKQIIELIIMEYTSKEIAQKLNISFSTVEAHRSHIFEKLKINNMAQLNEAARKLGII